MLMSVNLLPYILFDIFVCIPFCVILFLALRKVCWVFKDPEDEEEKPDKIEIIFEHAEKKCDKDSSNNSEAGA